MRSLAIVLAVMFVSSASAGIIRVDRFGGGQLVDIVSEGSAEVSGTVDDLSVRIMSVVRDPMETFTTSPHGDSFAVTINYFGYDTGTQRVASILRPDGGYQLSGMDAYLRVAGSYATLLDGVVASGVFDETIPGVSVPNVVYYIGQGFVVGEIEMDNMNITDAGVKLRFSGRISVDVIAASEVPEPSGLALVLAAMALLAVRRGKA